MEHTVFQEVLRRRFTYHLLEAIKSLYDIVAGSKLTADKVVRRGCGISLIYSIVYLHDITHRWRQVLTRVYN